MDIFTIIYNFDKIDYLCYSDSRKAGILVYFKLF